MRNDSSLNYNTPLSKIQNYKDFEQNIRKEKDSLKKVKRGYKKNYDGSNIANVESDKLKYNKISHKTDNNYGKEIISDFIDNLDEIEDTNHKYQIEKTQDKAKMESYQEFVQKNMMVGEKDFSDDSNVTSYMFFGNLKTLHRLCCEILELEEFKVNQILDDGHNWAEDHITTAKVQISQVYNFLTNKSEPKHQMVVKEDHQYNYMFFSNLEIMKEQCEKILSMDEKSVDETLMEGHDWAEDHVSSAKENVEQVHDFLTNEMM